jgi:alpha-ketoglutarate-dependent 2,4-dichlorophenoxyacetate dioxygenase
MRAVHPLVRTAPDGRPSLFVGAHAFRIVGLGAEEGYALIEQLLAFAAQPRFIYAHAWRQGDILIWDNRCTVHRGTEYDYRKYKRDMRRANVNEHGEDVSAIPEGLQLGMVAEPAKT